jgi:tyrosine-protein kinase Etk/Wzc
VIGETERIIEQDFSAPREGDVSLLDLLIVLARRKRLIFAITAIIVVLTVVICFLLPNEYTATTSLLPPQRSVSAESTLLSQFEGLSTMASMMGGGGGLGLKNPNDLQVALLKSQTVEDAMIDRFHLMDLYHEKIRSAARKDLEKAVSIENGAKDGLIRLSVTDRDPKRAADMANGYVDAFKKFSATLAVTEASQRRVFFERQMNDAKESLATAEEDLKKMEQTTGVLQMDAQTRAVIESVAQLRAEIAAKQVQIQAMRAFATGDNPQLQVAEQQLAALQAQQENMGATSDSAANALMVPKGKMQQVGLEYVRKLRDVRYYETIFTLLARQYEAAKIDEARQGAEVQVVDRATVPDHHSSPKRALLVLGSVFFGLLVGVVWALVAAGMHRISHNPVETERLQTLKDLMRFRPTAHR